MIVESLLKQFDLIVETPGNMPLFRRFIIDLAVRGKLVDKNIKDESSVEILKRIEAKRKLLLKDGKAQKQKIFPAISEREVPAAYLAHCVFERLANIAILEKGLTGIQSAKRGEYPLVVTAEARTTCDHFDFDGAAAIIPLVSSTGHGHASLNRLHYQEGKFALGTILCAVFPISQSLISARFLYEYLTAFKQELLVSKMIGTANVSLNIGKIGEVPIPIVSPSVQRRVGELMMICDQLEAAKTKREKTRDRLVASALYSLNEPNVSHDHARFTFNNISSLTTRVEHIKQLRQTILNLTVQGKLVKQDAKDEPASKFLSFVHGIDRKKGNRKGTPPIDDSSPKFNAHIPNKLPLGWSFCPLEEIFKFIDYRGRTPLRRSSGVRLITAKNVKKGFISNDPVEFIDEDLYPKWMTRGFPKTGDLLFVTEGHTMGFVGALNFDFKYALAQRTIVLQPLVEGYGLFYLFYLQSEPFQRAVMTNATGSAAQGIKAAKLKRIRVAVPPLAEQHRIAAKVDELMALCDQLEAQIETTGTDSRKLLEAVLHGALVR